MKSTGNSISIPGYRCRFIAHVHQGSFSPVGFAGEGIAGTSTDRASGIPYASILRWNGELVSILREPSFVQGVSDFGLICGTIGYGQEPFLYSLGRTPERLVLPAHAQYSHAEAINAHCSVVGSIEDEEGESAVRWHDGRVTILESGCRRATHITDSGWIAGLHSGGLFRYHDAVGFHFLADRPARPQVIANTGEVIYRNPELRTWRENGETFPLRLTGITEPAITGLASDGTMLGHGITPSGHSTFIAKPNGKLWMAAEIGITDRFAGLSPDGRIILMRSTGPRAEIYLLEPDR